MPDKILDKESCSVPNSFFTAVLKQSLKTEESPQQSTSSDSTSPETRDTDDQEKKMAKNAQQSMSSEERDREIRKIGEKLEEHGGKEMTEHRMEELRTFVTSLQDIVRNAERRKEKHVSQNPASVTFAIKAANKDQIIENQIIGYIKKEIPKDKLEIKTTFEWENRKPGTPLVVFCNYSSRIGVDVQVSLRGVQEPKVILIILHYVRRALIKGDLSDDDYLLPDNLKDRAICIAHFAFDDELYDCKQNKCSRDQLCRDLIAHYNYIVSKGNQSREASLATRGNRH